MKSKNSLYEQGASLLAERLEEVQVYLLLAEKNPAKNKELVHQIRISARRSMAVLKFYRTLLPKRRARWMRKQLKKIIRASNGVRDNDVFMAIFLKKSPPFLYQEEKEKLLKERLLAQDLFSSVCKKLLKGNRFKKREDYLLHHFKKMENQKKCIDHQLLLQEQLQEHIKKFFKKAPDSNASLMALHQFRIRVKELNYLLELKFLNFSPNIAGTIKLFQQKLGKMNDQAMFLLQLSKRLEKLPQKNARALRCILVESENHLVQMKEDFFHRYTALFFKNFKGKMIGFEKNSQ